MVFSSAEFLFLFLPCTLLIYYNPVFRGRKFRNVFLLLVSLCIVCPHNTYTRQILARYRVQIVRQLLYAPKFRKYRQQYDQKHPQHHHYRDRRR